MLKRIPFPIADNDEASTLLIKIFKWFAENNILYCVQRNYEKYPENITGDVDLIVSDQQLRFVFDNIILLARKTGWQCYYDYSWKKTAYIGLFKPIYPSRYTLTIELFAGARWHGLCYLPASLILHCRQKSGSTWKPAPCHQAIMTLIHHLLYNQTTPKKYRKEIISLVELDTNNFIKYIAICFSKEVADNLYNLLIDQNWSIIEKMATKLKSYLILYHLRSPVRIIRASRTFFFGYLASNNTKNGVAIWLDLNNRDEENIGNIIIELADKWHIYKPPNRILINDQSNSSEIVHSINILEKGGVVIIASTCNSDNRLSALTSNYFIKHNKESYYILKLINQEGIYEIIAESDYELVYKIWYKILSDQCLNKLGN